MIFIHAKKNFTISSTLLFLTAIACQLTDVTFGPVKVWELMAIIIFPLFTRKIETRFFIFITVFVLFLILSMIKASYTDIFYFDYGGLKSKYIISIVRFIELMLCIIVASVPFNLARIYNISLDIMVRRFINYNIIFTLAILFLFIADFTLGTNVVSYGPSHRLRAFYVEGGPYGLFLSTLFFLEAIFFKRKIFYAILLVALFLTQSKAGFASLAVFFFLIVVYKYPLLRSFTRPRNIFRFLTMVIVGIAFGAFILLKVSEGYINELNNISESLNERGDDPSLVMGRIAATYIGPNIILDNPYVGVGLGAYSLVRNDPQYRGPFPVVSTWDLTGLGGFFNLLIENGSIGLILFILAIWKYFEFKGQHLIFAILFIIPFIFGAQLYMVYPWFYLGFYSLYRREHYE